MHAPLDSLIHTLATGLQRERGAARRGKGERKADTEAPLVTPAPQANPDAFIFLIPTGGQNVIKCRQDTYAGVREQLPSRSANYDVALLHIQREA